MLYKNRFYFYNCKLNLKLYLKKIMSNNEEDHSESDANKSSRQAISTLDWFLFENKIRGIIKEVTVKAFVLTLPKWQKNSIIFRGGYDKGYKIFIADESLFVWILIYLLES